MKDKLISIRGSRGVGKNVASVDSMRAAIYEAIDIARRRSSNHEAKANPLEKHYHPSRRERD